MRYYVFFTLLIVAIVLDVAYLAMSFAARGARLPGPAIALAAPPSPSTGPAPGQRGGAQSLAVPSAAPTSPPAPTATATATPAPTATATATPAPTATATPAPRLRAARSVSFTPGDKAVRANIRLALAHYSGALTHVVLAPNEVFSFNAALGRRPQRLPWKNVVIKPTSPPPPPDGTPAPVAEIQRVQGGGLCDLASRYVMAARSLLPARAFRFVNHVRSNGIHLKGVPTRDAVSIWAVGGGSGEQDLKITNLTGGWLEWVVERDGETITVTARLWDRAPPGE